MNVARPRGTDSAKVIQVIETTALRGSGTEEDMCRIVFQYWDFNGNLLAEKDPCREGNKTIQTEFGITSEDEEHFRKIMEEYQKQPVRIHFSEKGESRKSEET